MDKIAFLFSGQGDQYPGMGKELCVRYGAAARVFELCDSIRPGTGAQCFEGTEEELKETKNTQPCLFAMELAAAAVLMDKGIRPAAVAGFSLGEVVAATAAGLFDTGTGFRLVCRRGELMQGEAEKYDTAMAAVVKLTPEKVEEICGKYPGIYPVNFNCPGQITVSGLADRMPAFAADVKAAGGRAVPLKVKGAFHSPFMKEAASAFAGELAKVCGRDSQNAEQSRAAAKPDGKESAAPSDGTVQPEIVIYSNVTAKPYTDDIAELLSTQICSPVRWEKLIRNMIAAGVDTFVEIGPGKTLTNMMKKIDAQVKVCCVAELSSVWTTLGVE